MNKILLLVFIFSCSSLKAQVLSTCQALESILSYEPATKPYYFDKNTSHSIIFYDTANAFIECSIFNYYNRKVEVSHRLPTSSIISPSDYIILLEKKTRNVLKFTLSYKSSGSYCNFKLKKKRNQYKVIKFREIYL